MFRNDQATFREKRSRTRVKTSRDRNPRHGHREDRETIFEAVPLRGIFFRKNFEAAEDIDGKIRAPDFYLKRSEIFLDQGGGRA